MRVLYIATSFPEPDKGATIYTDLAEALHEAGHELTVAVSEQARNLRQTQMKKERGFEVLRIVTGNYYDVGLIEKGITTLRIPTLMKKGISKYLSNRKFDFILYEAPPVTNSSLVSWAKEKFGCPSYLMLKDIFPQNAVDIGIMKKNSIIFKFFKSDAFELLIIELSSRHNIRPDILEKDYYVTLLLKELSEKQNEGLRAFFKGGTAIYKILESLNRFSEDIDITLDNSGLNGSQSKKNLKNATKEYVSLTFSADLEINQSSRTTEFSYSSIFDVDINDRLNRFGVVKVETTDFTISKPHEIHLISPLIYTISNKSEKNILENDYDINPFEIKTISIERIFIDKLFALENRILRHEYEEASKHAYDIHHLFKLNSITSLFSNTELLVMLINIQMDEENNRLNSNLKNIHPVNFAFHPILNREEKFIASFNVMQNIYVFNIENILEFQDLVDTIESISKAFNEMFAIENYLMIER